MKTGAPLPMPKEQPQEKQRSHGEYAALIGAVVFGIATWLSLNIVLRALFDGQPFSREDTVAVTVILITAISFLLYVSWTTVFLVFSSKRVVLIGSALLSLTPVCIFLGTVDPKLICIAAGIYFVTLLSAEHTMKYAYHNQVSFFLPGILRIGLSLLLLFTIAMISVLHYATLVRKGDPAMIIEGSLVKYSVAGVNTFLRQFEGYDPAMSVDAFILFAGSHEIIEQPAAGLPESIGGVFDIELLSGSLFANEAARVREEFLKNLGLEPSGFSGATPIREVWSAYVRSKSLHYLDAYNRFLPAIISVGLFLTLLVLGRLFKLLVYAGAWCIIVFFRFTGMLTLHTKQIEVKRLGF